MAYAQVDDLFADHHKNVSLSDAAFRLHVTGILYCNRQLTDGYIPADDVPRLVRRYKKAALVELLTIGQWQSVTIPDTGVVGYLLHDYLDWNPSRAVVEDRKAKARKRKRDWQERHGDDEGNPS